jgi:superfamily II DNA or RNA helicase
MSEFKLRDYQQEAINKTTAALADHNKVALILPTGAGKTEVFIQIAKRHLARGRGRVLVLSHLDILTKQTTDRFQLREPEIKTGILQGRVTPHVLSHVVISTMQSSRIEEKAQHLKDRLIRDIDLIIVDEAHHIMTDSYQKVLSYWPKAKVVGVTATPFRENQLMTNYFDTISFSLSLQELIDRGHLVQPKLFQMTRESSELTDIMAQVAKTYEEKESGNSAIIFMRTIQDAKSLRNVFVDGGTRAETITSKITGEERNRIIEEFNRGEVSILVTCDVLSAGFDSPRVSAVFQPYPVGSVTKYMQRIGRGLRTHPESGKKDCHIYVFGRAPSISKKFYEKVHNLTLNSGGEIKEYDTVTETLMYNEWEGISQERYQWNKEVADAVKKMQKLGMSTLSQKLDERDFPKRFLDNILNLVNKLPSSKPYSLNGNTSATPKQISLLKRYDFTNDQIKNLSKQEASTMISSLVSDKMRHKDKRFVLKSGAHAGKHVAETPWAYRTYVLNNAPTSEVAKIIEDWRIHYAKSNNSSSSTAAKAVPNS